MSDTGENQTRQASDEVRDEVKLDLDEGSIENYEAIRRDYATDPDAEMAHPATVDHGDGDNGDVRSATDGVATPSQGQGNDDEFDDDELVEEEDRDQEEDDWAPQRDEEE